jgi:integrase
MQISELIDPRTGERKYLNKEERQAFKNAVQYMKPDARNYCLMLYYTGCRLNEALEVSPDRLMFEEQKVIFRTLKQNKEKADRYRAIELPEDYLADLESQYSAKSRKGKASGKNPLWDFTDRTAQTYVKKAMKAAGITGKKASSRGLRHSMGVMLALEKVPMNVIADILGHKAVRNSMIYMQIAGEDRRELVSSIW